MFFLNNFLLFKKGNIVTVACSLWTLKVSNVQKKLFQYFFWTSFVLFLFILFLFVFVLFCLFVCFFLFYLFVLFCFISIHIVLMCLYVHEINILAWITKWCKYKNWNLKCVVVIRAPVEFFFFSNSIAIKYAFEYNTGQYIISIRSPH